MADYIQDPVQDRTAGVNAVRSTGVAAARAEAGLLVAQHNSDKATYVLNFSVAATAALDIVSLIAGANKVLRLRRVVLVNPGAATGPITVDLALGVATAIGSGGAAATPQPVDPGARASGVTGGPDAAFGGTARTGDTTQATGFTARFNPLHSVSVPGAAAGFTAIDIYREHTDLQCKPLTVAGASDVLVLRTPSVGAGAANMRGYVEFTVEDA